MCFACFKPNVRLYFNAKRKKKNTKIHGSDKKFWFNPIRGRKKKTFRLMIEKETRTVTFEVFTGIPLLLFYNYVNIRQSCDE